VAWAQGEFRFPRKRDLKKQGQSGSDADAPRETLSSCRRERGKPADEPESPTFFQTEFALLLTMIGNKKNLVAAKRRLREDS